MEKLTNRQAQVLTFIEKRIAQQGYPPTLREIGVQLGIRSTNGVNDHLKALERKGYISRQENRSRALNVQRPTASVVRAVLPKSGVVSVPVLGRVAAGEPILAMEDAQDSVQVDSFLLGDATRVYALRVVGDSMIEDGIHDGDYIFVRKQSQAERGSTVVAMIDGEVTVKRFYPEGERIRLQPANSAMQPIYIASGDFRETQILGTVVGLFRKM